MAHHHPVKLDPEDIERAQSMWASFTQGGKIAIIAVIASLVVLLMIYAATA